MVKPHPTILVIEDEELLLSAITTKLKLWSFNPLPCESGAQALDTLNANPEPPDAIWLDYYLKDMSGLDLMQQLKKDPRWASIPVLVVSNSASDEKVRKMLEIGAKRYVVKAEYRLDEIIAILRECMDDGQGAVDAGVTNHPK